jgi:hypothetical protein
MSPRHIVPTIAILAAVGLGGLFIAGSFVRLYFNRPPYLILLEPHGDSTLVQFIQPIGLDEKMEVSPKFKISLPTAEPFQAALTSSTVTVPDAHIEHGDITILPGAFHIRFGENLFKVLPARIIVDGQDYDWSARPVQAESVVDLGAD